MRMRESSTEDYAALVDFYEVEVGEYRATRKMTLLK